MATAFDHGAQPRPGIRWPHNLDAEASVLGGTMIHRDVLLDLVDLETDDFYDHRHKIVWEAIRNLEHVGSPIDVVTLEVEIEKGGKLDAIGGIAFLGELTLRVPTADNVRAYRDIVKLDARNRKAILTLASALESAQKWPHEAAELVAETAARLQRIDLSGPRKHIQLVDVPMALEEMQSLARAPVYESPYPTLNEAIGFGGFLGTQVYTIAAGTGRGKTSWCAEVAHHAAMRDVPVLVVSYEMRPGYFVARKAAGLIGTHSNKIIRGEISSDLVLRAMPVSRLFMLHKRPLSEVRLATQQLAQKFGRPPLVIVDYLQKLADEIARRQQRPDLRMATSEASDTLCEIADRESCAVLSVSAIGRANNRRAANPRKLEPYELVDVAKESGNVEYDGAGLIVLSLSNDFEGERRVATMTLAKARFGREVHVDMLYDGRRGSWTDRGEVTAEQEAPTESTEVLRMKITTALRSAPAKNATALFERIGGTRGAVFSEIKNMRSEGLISNGAYGLELPRPIPAQQEFGGAQ